MENLINSIKQSLENRNWYAGLTLALTLPDIAGKIEYPNLGSRNRFIDWFNIYILDKYRAEIGPDRIETFFLSGGDCYALRCAYLHEGSSNITGQNAREILDDFHFVSPRENSLIHCNRSNNKLQLQVDTFCTDIINGINTWKQNISEDAEKMERLNNLLTIHEIG